MTPPKLNSNITYTSLISGLTYKVGDKLENAKKKNEFKSIDITGDGTLQYDEIRLANRHSTAIEMVGAGTATSLTGLGLSASVFGAPAGAFMSGAGVAMYTCGWLYEGYLTFVAAPQIKNQNKQ